MGGCSASTWLRNHNASYAIVKVLFKPDASSDWGDLCEEDEQENDFSVTHGFRILSSYKLDTRATIWIITEADRSATTFLLPEEY